MRKELTITTLSHDLRNLRLPHLIRLLHHVDVQALSDVPSLQTSHISASPKNQQ